MNVAANYRYPGSAPFMDTEHDRSIFFGREQESQLVFYKIKGHDLLVLFAKSGIGKSSLLNAGVLHKLRKEDFIPFNIRLNNTEMSLTDSIYAAVEHTVKNQNIEYYKGDKQRLWTYFKTAEFWSHNSMLTPVLIFDQFEEFFTLPHCSEKKENFISQLSELKSGRMPKILKEQNKSSALSSTNETKPELKIIIVIREDYLAFLEEISPKIPNILENRFRLLPLNREQAQAAIEKPAALENKELGSDAFMYQPEAIKAILDFLCTRHERGREIKANEVESFQLQLLCSHLENNIKQSGKKLIEQSDLGGEKGMQKVLEEFYERLIEKMGTSSNQNKIRELCENALISSRDNRISLELGEIEDKYKVSEKDLDKLVKERLLRAEPRVGSVYYELSHDTLIKPIRDSQKKRANPDIEINRLYTELEKQINKLNFKEAKKTYKEIIKFDKNSARAYILMGKALESYRFNENEAVEIYEEAIKNKIDNADIYYELAQVHKNRDRLEEAKKYFQKAISIKSELSLAYIGLGDVDAKRKNYKAAVEYYEKALNANKKEPKAYEQLAIAYIQQDKPDTAIEIYERACKADAQIAYIYKNIAEEFKKKNIKTYLDKLYNIAAKVDSKSADYFNGLGIAFYDHGKYEEAIEQYKKAIQIDPEYKYAYNNLGLALADLEKYEEAIEQYKKALQIDPELKEAYYNLGLALADLEKYEEAIEQYKKALQIDPEYISAKLNLAEVYLISGDLSNAVQLSNDLLNNKELSSDDTIAMQTVSFVSYLLQNKTDKALEQINNLIAYYKSLDKDYERDWSYNELKGFIKDNKKFSTEQIRLISTLIEILEAPKAQGDKKIKELENLVGKI